MSGIIYLSVFFSKNTDGVIKFHVCIEVYGYIYHVLKLYSPIMPMKMSKQNRYFEKKSS